MLVAIGGCLTAPPPASGDCSPIVRNRFDDPGQWRPYTDPGAAISREPDVVWLSATPGGGFERAYADLQSEAVLALADSELGATLLAGGAPGAVAGIAWNRDEVPGFDDDDYYDLVVDSGILLAVRKPSFDDHTILCSDCPAYDPGLHAHLRLRAVDDEVVYQFSGDGRAWSDLARAPLAGGLYRAVAFVYADAPNESDLEVTEMAWSSCEP